ncbi:MAG TPA: hypothetical protein VJ883_10450 [Woeseiaceae bacterium]|nr:hypothetical protein [Woeseiaceae bacterium]
MRHLIAIFLAAGMVAGLGTTTALAQEGAERLESILEYRAWMYAEPDEYYFFEEDTKQVVDYKQERIVRVCVGDSRHVVPLKVIYDGSTAMIERGDCMRVEAKKISLEPAESLDANTFIRAEVQTMN